MHATISLLHPSLALVHIPRSRLHQLFHPILKQILQPSPTFLNITCNEVELSIFAEELALADFEPIARKDRHKLRARSSSSSSGRRKDSQSSDFDPVEVSYERWSVLQVDSHNDQIDNSGARVNEVSAPLAAAGISILYQSSYLSDFILVRKSRLQEAMALLADAGFVIYASGSDSIPIIPAKPKDRSSIHDFRSPSATPPSVTRARSGTDPAGTKLDSKSVWNSTNSGQTSRKKSNSPTAGDVRLLPSDLACVGLSEDQGADLWGLKIIKLVAFPELISPRTPPPSRVPLTPISPPILNLPSITRRKSSTPLFDFSPPEPDTSCQNISPISCSPPSSSSEDDGYFSHSPKKLPSSLSPQLSSRSQTDLRDPTAISLAYKHRSKHPIEPVPSFTSLKSPIQTGRTSGMPFFSYTRTAEGSSLTADVYVLAGLFPSSERYMIKCSGELDAADRRASGLSEERDWSDEADTEDGDLEGSFLSCLQIDLQRFGLDKYGLVNRFSKVLEENKINHMYSSSFKTANLLVDKTHARRAQALLNGC